VDVLDLVQQCGANRLVHELSQNRIPQMNTEDHR